MPFPPESANINTNAKGKSGAGVIYQLDKENGSAYVITNYHVVFDTDTNKPYKGIYVNTIGDQYIKDAARATVVGGSATFDLAVIYIENSELIKKEEVRAVSVFDSNELVAGTTAIAIGNPQGDGIAVTQGVVSVDSERIYMDPLATENVQLESDGTVEMRVIRIDTPVNPGNSGGGLYNHKGELIGIVNAKIISSEVESVGYAIPSNVAKFVADKLIKNHKSNSLSTMNKCLIGITISVISLHP